MVETDATKQTWKTSQKVNCPVHYNGVKCLWLKQMPTLAWEREWWDEAALVRKHSYLQRSTLFQFGTWGNRWQQPVKLPQEPSRYQNHSQPSFFCHFWLICPLLLLRVRWKRERCSCVHLLCNRESFDGSVIIIFIIFFTVTIIILITIIVMMIMVTVLVRTPSQGPQPLLW